MLHNLWDGTQSVANECAFDIWNCRSKSDVIGHYAHPAQPPQILGGLLHHVHAHGGVQCLPNGWHGQAAVELRGRGALGTSVGWQRCSGYGSGGLPGAFPCGRRGGKPCVCLLVAWLTFDASPCRQDLTLVCICA
eukprot:scaffold42219_cov23-Tisochrysis_lutea.AAC.3